MDATPDARIDVPDKAPDDMKDTTAKAWELIRNLASLYNYAPDRVARALTYYEQEHLTEVNQHLSDLIDCIADPRY